MRYTPVELRHVKAARGLFGYKRHEVDALIEDVADSFEEVWRERGELADRLEDVEKRLGEVAQRETLLASTLVAAEKTATEAIEGAKREAELIVAEAHHETRSITRAAQGERDRLFAEVRRVETLLRAALGMVEETRNELPAAPGLPQEGKPASSWPGRQDTREFQAITPSTLAAEPEPTPEPAQLPPVQEPAADREDDADDDGPWAARDFAWG
jgi:cell division initiation protein